MHFALQVTRLHERLSLRVEIVIIGRSESSLPLYQIVLGTFENEKIQQKRLESEKIVSKSDHMFGF